MKSNPDKPLMTQAQYLVDFRTGEVRHDVSIPGVNRGEIVSVAQHLKKELARQEAVCLKA